MEDQEKPSEGRKLPPYPLLDGHVRNKKKLVPPMLNLPETHFVSSIDLIFPEIVWVGILIDYHGLSGAIEVVSRFLQKLWADEQKTNWYRFSEICSHPDVLAVST